MSNAKEARSDSGPFLESGVSYKMDLFRRRSAWQRNNLVMRLGCFLVAVSMTVSLVIQPPKAKAIAIADDVLVWAPLVGLALTTMGFTWSYANSEGMTPAELVKNFGDNLAGDLQDWINTEKKGEVINVVFGGRKPFVSKPPSTNPGANSILFVTAGFAAAAAEFGNWLVGKYAGLKKGNTEVITPSIPSNAFQFSVEEGSWRYDFPGVATRIDAGVDIDTSYDYATTSIRYVLSKPGYYTFRSPANPGAWQKGKLYADSATVRTASYATSQTYYSNGYQYDTWYVSSADIRSGASLRFAVGSKPYIWSKDYEVGQQVEIVPDYGYWIYSPNGPLSVSTPSGVTVPDAAELPDGYGYGYQVDSNADTLEDLLKDILPDLIAGAATAPKPTPMEDPEAQPEPDPDPDPDPAPEEPGDSELPDLDDLGLPDLGAALTTRFPFSIPWDVVRGIKLLAAPAEAPRWEVDFLAPIAGRVGGWKGSTKIVIDMGEYPIIGQLSRWTIGFCLVLASGTKRLIWTA